MSKNANVLKLDGPLGLSITFTDVQHLNGYGMAISSITDNRVITANLVVLFGRITWSYY